MIKLLLIAITILLSGCSALGGMTNLRAVQNTPGWEQRPFTDAKYEHPSFRKYVHSNDPLTVTLCPSPDRWSFFALGPPLLPVLPIGLFMDEMTNWPPQLFMYVQIHSPRDKAVIDFAKARLRINDDSETHSPAEVARYGDDPRWDNLDVCGRTPDYLVVVEKRQEVTGTPAKFVLRFDVLENKVERAVLDLGAIRVGNQDLSIPSLNYEKASPVFYVPFVVPPEGRPGFAVFGGKIVRDAPNR